MKKNKKIIAFSVTFLFSAIYAILYKWWQNGTPFHISTILFGVTIFIIAFVSLIAGYKLFGYYLNKSVAQLKKIILPVFILFLLGVLILSFMVIGTSSYIFYLIEGFDTSNFMNHLFTIEFPSIIRSYTIWIFVASAFFFYLIWRQAIDREQQIREENLNYKYRTLKAQVNPHFLFNSLNTLSEIIYEDTKKADNYIQKLSKIYRYILDNEETDLIPLDQELEFVKQYFDMQKERDGNKILLNIDFSDVGKFKIVPVSLQILVENAFKHNGASENKPLEINIYHSEGPYITVKNNIRKKNTFSNSPGFGLSNLRDRVKLITDKEITVTSDNNYFIVRLPVVKEKI